MSQYNPCIHHRKSIRLKGYDYSQAGLYFITINMLFYSPHCLATAKDSILYEWPLPLL